MTIPAAVRRARLRSDASANAGRLSQVKTWLRAEIGDVAILPQDLAELRSGDVVMIDDPGIEFVRNALRSVLAP